MPATLLDQARKHLADGPPLDLNAMAAQDVDHKRTRTLEQASALGQSRAVTAGVTLPDVL